MPPNLTEQLDNLYTTTWQLMRKEAVDNIFKATPFWFWLTEKGRRRTEQGGRWIGVPVMYGKNTTIKSFGRGDVFTLSDDQILTTAVYNWKYIAGSVVRYWVDDQQNRGKAQIMSLMTAKLENLKLSLIDSLETQAFGDGTGNGGKDIHGLKLLVRDTAPTAAGQDVVGGIDAYTYDWWRNKIKDATGQSMTVNLIPFMRTMFNDCSKGNDTPDLILTHQTVFEAYENELLEIHRIVDKTFADAGFQTLTFKGKPIVWAPSCPVGYMYFLNSRYIEWVADEFANFEMTAWKSVQNTEDRAAQVLVAGNLVVSNRARLGVIKGLTTA